MENAFPTLALTWVTISQMVSILPSVDAMRKVEQFFTDILFTKSTGSGNRYCINLVSAAGRPEKEE
jgi:hypothetical protein